MRPGPSGRLAAAGVAVLGVVVTAGCRPPPEAGRPNVLLISIDSLSPAHLGCYGYRPPGVEIPSPSPTLDRLAREGTRFHNAVSTTSWTLPSHHALLCGLPDLLHGAFDDHHGPTPDRRYLPAELCALGYQTAGFYSGPYLHPAFGFAEGFSRYENASGKTMAYDLPPPERPTAVDVERTFHETESSRAVVDGALEFLEAREEDAPPFFLFLHFFDVHYDYRPPLDWAERLRGRRPLVTGDLFLENPEVHAGMDPELLLDVKACYDGEIYVVDQQIDRLLRRLQELELSESTLICVVSDHGDEFFEHGAKGHRNNLYDTTLRIALLLWWPGRIPAGRTVDTRVSIADVAPTLRETLRIPRAPDPEGLAGQSLWPLLEAKERQPQQREQFGFLHEMRTQEYHWAYGREPYKVIVRQRVDPERSGEPPQVALEVYDLSRDPGEKDNLLVREVAAVKEVVERCQARLRALYQHAGTLEAGPIPAASEAEMQAIQEQLRALGYVIGAGGKAASPTSLQMLTVQKTQPPPPGDG